MSAFIKTWRSLWVTAIILSVFQAIVLQFPFLGDLLEWSGAAVAQGEWWRLLTGHWVHLNVSHLGLNLAGLGLLAVLFDRPVPALWWASFLLAGPVAISLSLTWAVPELDWYRGFSGCLHGLFVMHALTNLSRTPLWSMALLGCMVAKLAAEAFLPLGSSELIGAAVIYQAHWLGALYGCVAGALLISGPAKKGATSVK